MIHIFYKKIVQNFKKRRWPILKGNWCIKIWKHLSFTNTFL